ncbi:hypothetical protein DJICPGNB_07340 [Escherichia coli]|nr:hypothetical protein DJICPGNB_07340 [Escherichia coli]
MFRRRGVTLTKALLTAVCMLAAPLTQAISVGNLTFSLPSETDFVSKRVVNNNKSARIYRIAISAIDSPGSSELRTRPVDGELLFAPRQLALQAGESEYFKFYYHGPRDNRERYYRVSFREVPTRNQTRRSPTGGEVSTEPVVVMDTGFAPIFPDICYHLTHYKPAAADIPVASDNPAHYADAIRYNARTPLQGSLLPLTRLVWA